MGTLFSAEAPSVGKRRENGENREKTGKLKNRGRAVAFSPAPARFISVLPIPQPMERRKRPLRRREVWVVQLRTKTYSRDCEHTYIASYRIIQEINSLTFHGIFCTVWVLSFLQRLLQWGNGEKTGKTERKRGN